MHCKHLYTTATDHKAAYAVLPLPWQPISEYTPTPPPLTQAPARINWDTLTPGDWRHFTEILSSDDLLQQTSQSIDFLLQQLNSDNAPDASHIMGQVDEIYNTTTQSIRAAIEKAADVTRSTPRGKRPNKRSKNKKSPNKEETKAGFIVGQLYHAANLTKQILSQLAHVGQTHQESHHSLRTQLSNIDTPRCQQLSKLLPTLPLAKWEPHLKLILIEHTERAEHHNRMRKEKEAKILQAWHTGRHRNVINKEPYKNLANFKAVRRRPAKINSVWHTDNPAHPDCIAWGCEDTIPTATTGTPRPCSRCNSTPYLSADPAHISEALRKVFGHKFRKRPPQHGVNITHTPHPHLPEVHTASVQPPRAEDTHTQYSVFTHDTLI